jgi:hypothetical protein
MIKGLSEVRRLPRIGKIHLGVKVQSDKGTYPRAVDYFVCDHPDFQKFYPGQPKELKIMIPVDDDEKWCSQYYRLYSSSRGLVCKGDGELCVRLVDTESGAMADKDTKETILAEMPCDGRECDMYGAGKGKGCTEVMNLQFLLPDIPGLGIWQIDTGSINSIRNINSAAELIRRLYGRISMLPIILTLEPIEVQADGKKKTIHVLNLRMRQTLSEIGQIVKALPALPEVATPVPDDEKPELILPNDQKPEIKQEPKPEPKLTKDELTDKLIKTEITRKEYLGIDGFMDAWKEQDYNKAWSLVEAKLAK